MAGGNLSTVGGGVLNNATAYLSTIAGGFGNTITGSRGTIGGGGRQVDADAATGNRVTDDFGTIGGGANNQAGDNAGSASDRIHATVAGGASNTASGLASFVGGGDGNTASGGGSVVAGGQSNIASADGTTIGGGSFNVANGFFSMILGGSGNSAAGAFSFAAGLKAKANHSGAFVWADQFDADFTSTANNQFNVRASGGVRIFSNTLLTAGVTLAAGGGSWSSVSDRNMKENFAEVAGAALLEKINAMPMSTWNYKSQDARIRHMGPMAQDFRAAFGLGEDERHIDTIDADGVALAGVQALYRLAQQQEAQLARQQAEISELREALLSLQRQPGAQVSLAVSSGK